MTITTRREVDTSYDDDRRSQLYASLVIFLLINNIVIVSRVYVHYRSQRLTRRKILLEDLFALLSALCVNAVCANLFVSTRYGLGLHGATINAHDQHKPANLANVFKYVWIGMVLQGPTFAFIKLSLLFLYRRLFLVNQKWLRIAWWVNLIYIILWAFGSTGFYLFQCLPVGWYWMRYYEIYDPTFTETGQCNVTTVEHVAIPLILGIFSDVALLCLPIAAIWGLRISTKKKLGLAGVFGVGLLGCFLELARTIQLFLATDDKTDPSYGVSIFLILSAAAEVCAILCSSLPVVVPLLYKQYQNRNRSDTSSTCPKCNRKINASNHRLSTIGQPSRIMSRGFGKLEEGSDSSVELRHHASASNNTDTSQEGAGETWPMRDRGRTYSVMAATPKKREDAVGGDGDIVVRKEVHVTAKGSVEGFEEGRHVVRC